MIRTYYRCDKCDKDAYSVVKLHRGATVDFYCSECWELKERKEKASRDLQKALGNVFDRVRKELDLKEDKTTLNICVPCHEKLRRVLELNRKEGQ